MTGALAVAVPGELAGYYAIHDTFGKLPWKSLFKEALKVAKDGFYVDTNVEVALAEAQDEIASIPRLK